MILYTIGFTRKSAEQFFTLLNQPGLKRVVDIRLNNASQLAGFAKRDDLQFFLKKINGIEYIHMPELAPAKEILEDFRKDKGDWRTYKSRFLALLEKRAVATSVPKSVMDGGCLLCSEAEPDHCHRKLVALYFQERWGGIDIRHL
jgi:uncharacterized protein (DUF488 family)